MKKDIKKLKPKPPAKAEKKAEKPIGKEPKADLAKKKKMATEVSAKARFIHIAPRKVRLVINQLKGLKTQAALDLLRFTQKSSVLPVTKLINSAIANAEHNFQINKDDLFIKKFIVNAGPVIKRFRPRAHGRAAAIRHRTSQIELTLGVRPGAKKKIVEKEVKAPEVKLVKPEEVKKEALKIGSLSQSESNKKEKGKGKGFLKSFFQRKTG